MLSNASGDFVSLLQQVFWVIYGLYQAPLFSFLSIKDFGAIHPLKRLRNANDSRQKPAGTSFRHDTQFVEYKTDTRFFTRQTNVHRQCHGCTNANGRAIYGSDNRLFAVKDYQCDPSPGITHTISYTRVIQALFHVGHCWLLAFIQGKYIAFCGQIHASTKGPPRTGDNNRTNFSVITGFAERINEFVCHFNGKRIESIWPI